MVIKKEYINKTRNYLIKLEKDVNSIDFIKEEIEDLKRKDKYQEINIAKAIFKDGNNFGIDDTLVHIKSQIDIKESEISHILRKYEKIKLFLSKLPDNEKLTIEYKYFNRKEDNSKYKNKDIERVLRYSASTIKRIEKRTIEKIAIFIYKDDALIKLKQKAI